MEYVFIPNLTHTIEPRTFHFSYEIQNVNVVKLKLNVPVVRHAPSNSSIQSHMVETVTPTPSSMDLI
jgi:hypothetical protein